RLWRAEEIEAAKEPVRERVHLATGLLLPVWKRLPGDHVRVTRIVSADGTSIIGREVVAADIAKVSQTFGLGNAALPTPGELAALVLSSGTAQTLQSHDPLTVKRSLVGGEQRIELTGFAADRLEWYKAKGCFTEIIRYRTRLFVPVAHGPAILETLAP
ncbi:hypothetical protein N3930_40850, partial [Bacillus thuringiensis]|nr:hypothetical protein [Bacillus thuringiensis]